jgi:hypothetical protein
MYHTLHYFPLRFVHPAPFSEATRFMMLDAVTFLGAIFFVWLVIRELGRRRFHPTPLLGDRRGFPLTPSPWKASAKVVSIAAGRSRRGTLDGRDCQQPQAQFSQLCESMKDAPPEEQASRVRKHFGVFGGARPPGADSDGHSTGWKSNSHPLSPPPPRARLNRRI